MNLSLRLISDITIVFIGIALLFSFFRHFVLPGIRRYFNRRNHTRDINFIKSVLDQAQYENFNPFSENKSATKENKLKALEIALNTCIKFIENKYE